MTNAESVDKYRLVAWHILAMRYRANCGVNRMKFITLTTISCHSLRQNLETLGKSSAAGSFIFVMGNERADMAAVWALSLPTMLTWLGIQHKIIVLPLLVRCCLPPNIISNSTAWGGIWLLTTLESESFCG